MFLSYSFPEPCGDRCKKSNEKCILISRNPRKSKYKLLGCRVGYQEIDFLVPDSYRTIQTTPLSIKITNENTSYDLLIKDANKISLLRQRLESLKRSKNKKNSVKLFLRSEGKVRGPFSLIQLLPRLKSKNFTILDEISDSETGPWLPIMRSPLALSFSPEAFRITVMTNFIHFHKTVIFISRQREHHWRRLKSRGYSFQP